MAHVLVVDDDPLIQRIYSAKLIAEGHDVAACGTGAMALAHAAATRPDIVLLDLMLPDIRGVEVLRRLRAAPATAAVPVVVLSNVYLEEDIAAARAAGATAVAAKASTRPREVVELVQRHLAPSAPPMPAVSAPAAPPAVSNRARIRTPPPIPLPELPSTEAHLGGARRSIDQALAQLRKDLPALRAAGAHARDAGLVDVERLLRQLVGAGTVAHRTTAADLAAAAASLVRGLREQPERFSVSTQATLLGALDAFERHVTAPRDRPVGQLRALAIDDDAVALTTVRHALAKIGLACDTAESGERGLELAGRFPYAVVLSDVSMGRMNGFAFVKALHAMPIHAGTPVILVTALHDFEGSFRVTTGGAVAAIGKPFLIMELAVKVLSHL